MTYSLRRTRDDAGDSGNMSLAIHPNAGPGDEHVYEHGARPKVGVVMRVGSLAGRTFGHQDYWQTTVITEITDEWVDTEKNANCIRFKTGNSVYIWKHF